jgi:hypothetical protein
LASGTWRAFFTLASVLAICGSTHAQSKPTITVRMLDSSSGRLIPTSDFLVQINHQTEQHAGWVKQNLVGAGELTLPPDATTIAVHATYEKGMSLYVNCDAVRDRGSSDHAPSIDHWYSIADILTTGILAPNGCLSPKKAARIKATAKPGEFVFFVRKLSWRDDATD